MKVWNWRPRHDVTPFRRNDSRRHRLRQSERAAHRQNPVAHLHAVGIAHLRGRQDAVHFDFDYCQISFLIGTDDFGIMLHARRIIFETDPNAIRLLHYVAVGNDVSLGVDDHA